MRNTMVSPAVSRFCVALLLVAVDWLRIALKGIFIFSGSRLDAWNAPVWTMGTVTVLLKAIGLPLDSVDSLELPR